MKIALIDYYLDEWHANNYQNFMKIANEALGTNAEITRAYGQITAPSKLTSKEWCMNHGVKYCESIDEACSEVDAIMVLSPDNPEMHLSLATNALKFGKPVYVDKPFCDSLENGKKIFDIAKEYNSPMFSTSALRYADNIIGLNNAKDFDIKKVRHINAYGMSVWNLYSVHVLEMVEAITKQKPLGIIDKKPANGYEMEVRFESMTALINMKEGQAFRLEIDCGDRKITLENMENHFENLTKEIIKFFETKVSPVDKTETLRVTAMIEAGLKAEKVNREVAIGE